MVIPVLKSWNFHSGGRQVRDIVFMGFFSFSSPLATVQVPIFCPAFLLLTDPLLFLFWHLISALKARGEEQRYDNPSLDG